MSGSPSIDVQALLAQQDWVERLARGLVRDSSLAQDLAQEAWLTASRKGPAEPGALRGFLAGVVRNRLRAEHRSATRRERREAAAARPEVLPSSADLAGKLELHRVLLESVLALEEQERTALQLCYFEGLTAEEIARRANLPASTVRARIQRGLERLRGRLERRVDRRDLFAGLVALARLDAAPDVGTTLPWIGALTMKTLLTATATCAALIVAASLWFSTRDTDTPRSEAPALAPAEAPREVASVPLAAAESAAPVPAARTELASPVAETSEAPAPAAPAPARILARLVDENGVPVIDAEVRYQEQRIGSSAADGSVDLSVADVQHNYTSVVEFLHPRFARARRYVRLTPGAEVPLGEVVLAPAGEVRGRVEDELGAPVAGARVVLAGLENGRTDPEELRRLGPLADEFTFDGVTDERGRFTLGGVPVRPQRLWAGGEGLAWKSIGPIEPARGGAGDDVVLVLAPLDASDRITGRVLDPDGQPVANAEVRTWFMAANIGTGDFYRTDEAGRFEILVQQRVAHDLTVSDAENRWSELYARQVEPGTRDLELRFSPAVFMDVHVTDEHGVELGEGKYALDLDGDGSMTVRQEPAGPGRARVRVPNTRFRLTASALGYERGEQGPFEPGAAPLEVAFALVALPGIRGRVITADGNPAAGAKVSLVETVSDQVVLQRDGFRCVFEHSPVHQTTADADGRFVLYPPAQERGAIDSGLAVVRADFPGYARTELAPRAFDPHQAIEVELHLVHGGAIEGRALTARGVDPAGLVLAVHRGDGDLQTLRLGSDGRYRIVGLTPGPWEVRALDDELVGNRSSSSSTYYDGEPAPPMEDWTCTVVDGETTRFDLDLSDRAPCRLAGRLALGSATTAGWTAELQEQRRSDPQIVSGPLGAGGGFELTVERAGSYRLVLRGPDEGHGRLELSETLELDPGASTWELELPCGGVTGDGAVGRGTRERFHRYRWGGSAEGHELAAELRIVADAEGRFALPVVPAGRGAIERNDPPGQGQDFAPWETVATFEVPPGATRAVTLP